MGRGEVNKVLTVQICAISRPFDRKLRFLLNSGNASYSLAASRPRIARCGLCSDCAIVMRASNCPDYTVRWMSIVISVKASDGIVLAANSLTAYLDSASLPPRRILNNSHRIFDLTNGAPTGAIAFGIGGIGSDSISMLSDMLRDRLKSEQGAEKPSLGNQTVEQIARQARALFFEDRYRKTYPQPPSEFALGYRVCGFSADASVPQIWEFTIEGTVCTGPYEVQPGGTCGIRWAGENKILDRLLLGQAGGLKTTLLERGYTKEEVDVIYQEINSRLACSVEPPFASTESAIEIAGFLVELAPSLMAPGPAAQSREFTEIAAITRAEGFRWVLRRQNSQDDAANDPAKPLSAPNRQ